MNLSYVAGLMDGEGSIGFTKSRSAMVPRISITNTNLELLQSLQSKFGGWIWPLSLRKEGWKQGYSWVLANKSAVDFVKRIEKWLILKKEQCWLLYAWDEIRPGRGRNWSEESLDALKMLNDHSKWLNWKGCNRNPISPIDEVLISINHKDD